MKEHLLRPIRTGPKDYEKLEVRLIKLFKSSIYLPLLKYLKASPKILNSINDLLSAISAGDIRYEDNGFAGVFSSVVSRELKTLGAVWSKRNYKWLIRIEMLTPEIQAALQQSHRKDEQLKTVLKQTLDRLSEVKISEDFDATTLFEDMFDTVERDFQKSVKRMVVVPKVSAKAKDRIAKEYSDNLKLYIKDFTKEQILKLRQEVVEHTFKGNRYEELVSKLQTSYGIAQRKAKFLARQETKLLTSKIKETRYADAGIDTYVWQTVVGSTLHPVRKFHKKLDGTIQHFSKPPITDKHGNRNNPGEDFNCRCTARPIVKL